MSVCRTRRSSGVNVCMAMGVCSAGGRRALPPSTAARATAEPEARGAAAGADRGGVPWARLKGGSWGALSGARWCESVCCVGLRCWVVGRKLSRSRVLCVCCRLPVGRGRAALVAVCACGVRASRGGRGTQVQGIKDRAPERARPTLKVRRPRPTWRAEDSGPDSGTGRRLRWRIQPYWLAPLRIHLLDDGHTGLVASRLCPL